MATTENGTYYPSDYSSVADVPGDMKKMAESIDANKVQKIKGKGLSTNDFTNEYKQKLEDLENYDDTEVKKDISDIKEEQETQNTNIENLQEKDTTQDELIEKLQQENKNIKSALINVETEQAKSLHIEDASTVAGVLEVEGNAEQETREGYNLLNSSLFNLSEVSNYATFNKEDGTITFNGTANTDINIRSLRKQIIAGTGKENIVIKIISGSLNGLLRLAAQDTDYGNIKYSQIGTSSFVNKLTESVEYNIFSITITNGTVMNNLKLGFMIVDDSNLDKEYEQYGAMPSPGFPSKVKCLGSNKNILNDENNKGLIVTTDNITNSEYMNVSLENNKYYIARIWFEDGTYAESNNFMLYGYNSSNQNIASIPNNQVKTYTNATEIVKAKIVANTTGISAYENKKIEGVKIEETDENGVATSYSPYRAR